MKLIITKDYLKYWVKLIDDNGVIIKRYYAKENRLKYLNQLFTQF